MASWGSNAHRIPGFSNNAITAQKKTPNHHQIKNNNHKKRRKDIRLLA